MRLFVSYAHVDTIRVAELAKDLAARGFEVWWDDHLEPGDDWKAELIRRIHGCDAFLFVASGDSTESEWCQWELAQATALAMLIVPVIIRAGIKLPRAIAGLQYVDASAGLDSGDFAKLVERLAKLRQTGVSGASSHRPRPRGFPARFTRPLPPTYRTVSQGYLRPAAPNTYAYKWPPGASRDSPHGAPLVGIDFGTSTSAVALYRGDALTLVPNNLGETSTPSAVAIAEDGTPLVGQRAQEFLLRRPDRGVLEVKRLFGLEMARELGGPPVLEVDGISYSPIDLAAFVFCKLRSDAEAYTGAAVFKAVLTAPAHFDQVQRVALMQAARLAGLEVLRVIPEPVAACMAVHKPASHREPVALVYDLGGGTFDVCVVNCGEGAFEVKSVNGDTHLGGADFDRVVVDYCIDEFRNTTGVDVRGNAAALMRLREEVERAKIELSSARTTTVSVPFVVFGPSGQMDLNVELTRTRYNELTHGLVTRTVDLTRTAIDDAGVALADIDEVVAVGRAARTPSVRLALQDLFGEKLRTAPDHVVAMGAGVQAGVLEGKVKDTLLLDILSSTLRVQVAGGRCVPMIAKHSTIPTRKGLTMSAAPSQSATLLRILAGESSRPDSNLPLLEFQVPHEPAQKEGPNIELTLEIDANGRVTVKARPENSGRSEEASFDLRGSVGAADEWVVVPDMTSAREALLPVYHEAWRLGPMHDAALTDIAKVQRWLLEAAANRMLEPEMSRWAPGDIELLVDALEQRVGLELPTLRHCHSIAAVSERLVQCVRESRQ
jgi:molecular chaperone DnaK